jgi:hypothetical protein
MQLYLDQRDGITMLQGQCHVYQGSREPCEQALCLPQQRVQGESVCCLESLPTGTMLTINPLAALNNCPASNPPFSQGGGARPPPLRLFLDTRPRSSNRDPPPPTPYYKPGQPSKRLILHPYYYHRLYVCVAAARCHKNSLNVACHHWSLISTAPWPVSVRTAADP